MNRLNRTIFLFLFLLISQFQLDAQPRRVVTASARQLLPGPDQLFGKLFQEVQLNAVFPDSKTFADCTPKASPAVIMAAYEKARTKRTFDLKAFVDQYFTPPVQPASGYTSKPSQSARQHILDLWPVLTRPADGRPRQSGPIGSLIPLAKPYVVPGGRFGEIYYWDSYFTMLGLQASGQIPLIQHMVDNFSYLINTFGFIPNGNRTYFLGRSQPPFFSLMVNLLMESKGKSVLSTYLPVLQKEYDFWMDGQATLTASQPAYRRVVRLADGVVLNRYYDDKDTPRPESYKEDVALAKNAKDPQQLYRHIRAGAESGWDFSSRWFRDGKHLRTIHTTDFIPVDLNCLLLNLEQTLAEGYKQAGNIKQATFFQQRAQQRQQAILQYCWQADRQFFFDYDFVAKRPSTVFSLAGVFPLFVNLATADQALAVGKTLKREFLKQGGLTTTLVRTGEQWDAPNGWAPLQWISIKGLRNYKQESLANEIKLNWVTENLRVYKATGKMVEKYDVINTAAAKGGEYPNQDGFGWTNGVLLRLLTEE
jgi:alpha,alpha-trehalase